MVYVDDGSEDGALGMFEEPAGYYQPEKQPTTVSHRTMNGQELILRLIGLSPLWVGDHKFDLFLWAFQQAC